MIKTLTELLGGRRRAEATIWLALAVLLSTALIGYRMYRTGSPRLVFLIWNLWLALIPYGTGLLIRFADRHKRRTVVVAPLLVVWLLFFPNAPYLVTDLVHLMPQPDMLFWYDLVLLLSCAWNGLLLGLLSLHDVQAVVARRSNRAAGRAFALAAIVLGSFGIYLGRFQRWNSWDVMTRPSALLGDAGRRLLHPAAHLQTWALTALFAVFLVLAYVTLVRLMRLGVPEASAANQPAVD